MFQSFTATVSPTQGPPRLASLRDQLDALNIDGFVVPRADRHQGEYVAPHDARLEWLTGFTGSAGFVVVLRDRAALFVDGRYTVQARAQAADEIEIVNWPETRLHDWMKAEAPDAVLGFDPWLHTAKEIETLKDKGVRLKAVENPVDAIWHDQPPAPSAPVMAYPAELAGETSADKRRRIADKIKEQGAQAAVITLPDSICWLLNIRGQDIPRNPVVHAFALLRVDATVTLFSDPEKFDDLDPDPAITLENWAGFDAALAGHDGPLLVDPATAPQAIFDLAPQIVRGDDPCILPKAIKSDAEIAATRSAHLRDGAAMVEFLCWLDVQPPGSLTEIAVVKELEARRRATNSLRDISFETIAGTGANAAIVHYRVTEDSDAVVEDGHLLLIDSGGQYIDGTTDITRTIAIGTPTHEHRRAFTAVLQGMIALSRVRFPKGVAGAHLDALARFPLWSIGLDFDHGTGHGVGVYLNVHEGPQRISRLSDTPLEPGMILSNEPGYYRAGAFGIRIENLVVVRAAPEIEGQDDRPWRDFVTLTWVPVDRRLIDADALSRAERDWIDSYHRQVREHLSGALSPEAQKWLEQATAPL